MGEGIRQFSPSSFDCPIIYDEESILASDMLRPRRECDGHFLVADQVDGLHGNGGSATK